MKTAVGNYDVDPLGSGFGLVFLSATNHCRSLSGNPMLIGKAAAAAAPNRKMVVHDFTVDEDRTRPPFPPLFPVNMLVGTEAGDTYTESEVRQWMEKVRLRHVDRKDIPFRTSPIIETKEGDERRGESASRR